MQEASETNVEQFIARWRGSQASERGNSASFINELCALLGVAAPNPATKDPARDDYVYERAVLFNDGEGRTSTNFIDLYKRGCFVLEAKQGSERGAGGAAAGGAAVRGTPGWDVAMRKARGQAERYVRALPPEEGNPPFLVVTDIGHTFELYSDFSRAGKIYVPFPDPRTHRVALEDLRRAEVRERLRQVWTDPLALDPSRRSARVTREVARSLAELARSLEESGHAPERAANFLMRAIFTMFAEDIGLLPRGRFTELLESLRETPEEFRPMMESVWRDMNEGGYSQGLRARVLRFNGGLFESQEALALDRAQLALLTEASRADWKGVEPAIFGTLLERALDPAERHRLGAHYTPRAYVERLVMPSVVEPLREEWADVLAAAVSLAGKGREAEAAGAVKEFHGRLCRVRVLDPACGSGNFLYVTLEHLKRLEGEVLDALHGFGERQGILEDTGLTVDPHQLLGLEVNPRAAAIADLVLWIGYLQWHARTRGEATPPEPVIRKFRNIERRDAVLAYDAVEEVRDARGEVVTRWDGRTTKTHPATGEAVPDETARTAALRYTNARKADWPAADFIIGNPPFIGTSRMRATLGDGYVEALRKTYADVPESSDYVMYWWDKAAELTRAGKLRRFGFITTNSLRQTFNRRVLERHLTAKNPLSLTYTVPDHPWVDDTEGAAVRISMTAAEAGEREGLLARVTGERDEGGEGLAVEFDERSGKIFADLTIGANVAGAEPLKANEGMSNRGVVLHGAGFIVTPEEAARLGLGRISGIEKHIRQYRNGRDLTGTPRGAMVIDLFGLAAEEVRGKYPEVYQWILERVKPERDNNNRPSRRENWWIFGEPISTFRPALARLERYIATVETSKHRFFVFLDESILPDNKLVNIALDDAYFLGVLSSRVHVTWALATGSTLEDRPVYVKTTSFEKFPFPDCDEAARARVRELGEQLDAHRKRQQSLHPRLTVTEMYNVLEKLRADFPLDERERATHEAGLVSVLRQIHDDLDSAVRAAYGWTDAPADAEILARLVRLNAARAAEERRGRVRWLRPDFQRPDAHAPTQGALDTGEPAPSAAPATAGRQPWPKSLPEQARAVRLALNAQPSAVTAAELARTFGARATPARVRAVEELLQTLASLGQAREVGGGRYLA
ncbi:MAG: class I SAM-dependent DNA methyltransferase [Acidobacteria bacterium]|nr:class I SAM-dependent DNA methyltransferase [Acidobacteriota bacterium]